MTILVEGFAADAVAVAALLASEGDDVRIAGAGAATPEALALRGLGVRVDECADLDADPGEPGLAYMDVWTPEVAPRVRRLRSAGTRLTCLADLVLERSPAPVIGVTGTAGKTTTTGLVAHLLRTAGIPVLASDGSPSANMWPDGRILAGLAAFPRDGWVVIELTSSHLAFMSHSPQVAVITTFWPDHVELHGSLEAYRAAKETIVRHQCPGGFVVVDDDDPATRGFADLTPAEVYPFSTRHPGAPGARGERGAPGAYLDGPDVVLVQGGVEVRAARPTGFAFDGERAANVVAACAAALASGVPAAAVAAGLADPPAPVLRARQLTTRRGLRVIDDGMAATPGKTRATLASLPGRSAVVVCGGETGTAGGPVHGSAAEVELIRTACREIARVARSVVAFGGAADRLCGYLEEAGVAPSRAADLGEAVALATGYAAGSETVVFSPMFPLAAEDRARFSQLVEGATTGSRVQNP